MTSAQLAPRAHASIDLGALRSNVRRLADAAPKAEVMAVVKADAYGHGLLPCAAAARAAGATWLGVALPEEALALRAAGDTGRILTWLTVPGDPIAACIAAGIDVSAYDVDALVTIGDAALAADTVARVHLKADTGLSRGGATAADWPEVLSAADRLARDGVLSIAGIWSHLAYADAPGHPVVARQVAAFESALAAAARMGIEPEVRHLANSAATLCLPATHYDLVRPGIAVYGVSPGPALGTEAELGLEPVMTLHARLALVKEIAAGAGISYGHEYVAAAATRVGLVPLGYADGIPRAATNVGPVLAAGAIRSVAGRVCMDQFVVDLGSDPAVAGDDVVVFGSAARGEPTAADWAAACDTIGYEIVTRIGVRVPRIPSAGREH